MATIEQFKELKTAVSSEDQAQIAELYLTDRDSAVSKMIGIASDKGVTLTSDEVQNFISEMNEDDEFDDIKLTAATLSSISGGYGHRMGC
tara:strand:- start:231 stop:500 length:270 start_codon:yes stop_codon:yes gene_type:complete